MRTAFAALTVAVHTTGALAFPPGVRAVRQGAPAGGDGLTWQTAYGDVQEALAAVAGNPQVNELWVASGTYYTGPQGAPITSVIQFQNLAVYGGFAGNEVTREQRNWTSNLTILSNDLDRSGTASAEDSASVVVMSGDSRTRLDGFRVTGDRLYSSENCCALTFSGSGVIANCEVLATAADWRVAALQMVGEPGAAILSCHVDGRGYWNSGIRITGTVSISDSMLLGSQHNNSGPGLYMETVELNRCLVEGQTDGTNPVRILNLTAADSRIIGHGNDYTAFAVLIDRATLLRCRVSGSSRYGGLSFDTLHATDTFLGGSAEYGAGVSASWSELRNSSISAQSRQSLRLGVAHLDQCTVVLSSIGLEPVATLGPGSTITGSVLWPSYAPYGPFLSLAPGEIGTVNYSCIYNWDASLGGVGNTAANPLLAAQGRLGAGSPCIDAGPPAPPPDLPFDVDGGCRLLDGNADGTARIDMGAFEFGQCYANCDCSTTVPLLTVLDFQCFLDRFAQSDSRANCDNSTAAPALNVLDFNCFLNRFGAGCP